MELNDRQRFILMGVLQDQKYLSGLPTGRDIGLSGDDLGRRRIRVRDAQVGLVPMNLDGWIGHAPCNSECVLFHREYERLEKMGFLERHNLRGGHRTSHLRLTPAGKELAERLVAEEYGLGPNSGTQEFDWSGVLAELDLDTPAAGEEAR